MKQYNAILFDFDGVLLDSDRVAHKVALMILEENGIPEISYDDFRHRGTNHWDWYRERGVSWTDERIGAFFDEHHNIDECELMEGARDILALVAKRKIPCGIVSAHPEARLKATISSFEISRHFHYVRGDSFEKTDEITRACEFLSAKKENTLFVGDMLSDVLHGQEAGVKTVLFAPKDSPHKHHADYHITHISQILEILDLL